jgi:hypothetical protein
MNEKAQLKATLIKYLNTYSFCSADEFLLSKNDKCTNSGKWKVLMYMYI